MFQVNQVIENSELLKAEIAKPIPGAKLVSDESGVSLSGCSASPLSYLSPKAIVEIAGLLVDAVNYEATKRHKDDRSDWKFCDWIAGSHGGSGVIQNAKGSSKYTFSNFIKISMLICPDCKYMLHHFEVVSNHHKFRSSVIADRTKTNLQRLDASNTTKKRYKGKKRNPELLAAMIKEYLSLDTPYKQAAFINNAIKKTHYSESTIKNKISELKNK